MNVVVRKLKASDSVQIQKLMVQQFLLHTQRFEREKPNLAIIKAESAKMYKNFLHAKHGCCFVADSGPRIVGYVGALTSEAKNKGYLDELFVASRYRKQGIGKLLMQQAFAWFKARGIKRIELDVHRDNETAIATYKKLGFKRKPQEYATYELQIK